MVDLCRIINAVKSSSPPAFPGCLGGLGKSADPAGSNKEDAIITELFKVVRQLLPRFLEVADPTRSPDPERSCDLARTGKNIVEKCRAARIALPQMLICLNPVKKHFLHLVFDSGEDPDTVRCVVLLTEGFFAELLDGILKEWLRLETQKHHRQRLESRRSLLSEKKRYATIFHRMNEPAFVVDEGLHFVDVNPAFTSFFGLKRRAVLGSTCCSIIGRKFCAECPLKNMIQTGGSFSNLEINITVPARSGSNSEVRSVRLAGSSLGDIKNGGIVIIQDITSHKRFEIALQESEEKYRSLIENLPDVSWRADREGRLLFASPNLEKICRVKVGELLGRDRFERLHPEDIEQAREAYGQLFTSGIRFDMKYRFLLDDESWIWIHDRADSVIESDGQLVADGLLWDVSELKGVEEELDDYRCWLEDFVDERTEEIVESNERLKIEIAERKQVEKELVLMTASLKRSNAELEQFAHVASHDLKEPLMLVKAFSERLLHRYGNSLEEKGNEYLSRIVKAADQLQELVDALLDMSRVSISTRVFEPLAMNALVGDVLSHLEEMIRASGATVRIEQLHNLNGDPVQIRQLFQNMIVNAIKYRREDVPLAVNIRSRVVANDICEITVADNGIGFDQADCNRIFDPFVRLHARGKYEGSGMGLTTCKKIVHRHGGDIFARSNKEGGALFIIRLPMRHPG